MKEIKYFIGIDVGITGAISILNKDGELLEIIKTPETIKIFAEFIDKYKENSICMIEKVHSFPLNSAKASFSFGEIFGITKTIIQLKEIPHYFVSPQRWINFYIMKKNPKESETMWKNKLLQRSQQLFPKYKIYKYMADSVLIANYLIQMYKQNNLK